MVKSDWILYIGTFPPRECGIATFTKDLTTAMDSNLSPFLKSKIAAMNNELTSTYNYPKDVMFQINDKAIEDYIDVAKKINNIDRIKLINIQHEFGIFGGEYGDYLIAFLELIKKPVTITFHSVLPKPGEKLKKAVQALAERVNCIIVMAETAVKILREDYGIKTDIKVIPHGIPTVPLVSSKKEKEKIGHKGKTILLSFGMINSGKGYEYVINALPNVVKKFPDVLYLIVGETHPVVRKQEGEDYRNLIGQKVKALKLEKHVKFYNKYVKLEEIVQYLKAADIYICSNLNPNQITSGTLAYAVGAGRATVSTPFLHAKELVTPERGVIVNFNDSKSFGDAIIRILSDPKLKKGMELNAYENTRNMLWCNVALAYNETFKNYIDIPKKYTNIPEIKMDHLTKLTDDFGMIQFANYNQPNKALGYTLDDNARAMIACCRHFDISKDNSDIKLISLYLNFVKYVSKGNGRLYNFVSQDRKINFDQWSEDAQGRAIWSLGFLLNTKGIPAELKQDAENILKNALQAAKGIKSPRAVAYSILGLYHYNLSNPSQKNVSGIKKMADYLLSSYKKCASKEWRWFEEYLTYANSRLPEALFYAYLSTKNKKYMNIASSSLDFLLSITFEKGVFSPIGERGWYMKKGQKAHFDQQPINTSAIVQALILASEVTKKRSYMKKAVTAFQWFLGKNSLNQVVYDESTGGCFDGVGESAINLNQGAESTISYLLARFSIHDYKDQILKT